MMARWINAEPDLKVVAALHNGREAIEQSERAPPGRRPARRRHAGDRRHHGAAAAPGDARDLVVLMVSTLTRRNAEVSLRALSLGALDYLTKPETNRDLTGSLTFRRDLIDKIRALGSRKLGRPGRSAPAPALPVRDPRRIACRSVGPSPSLVPGCTPDAVQDAAVAEAAAILARRAAGAGDRLVDRRTAGGERGDRRPRRDDRSGARPHHPAHAADLHRHLRRASCAVERPVRAARRSTASRYIAGRVYVAPGGRHMRVVRSGTTTADIALDDGAPDQFLQARGRSAVLLGGGGVGRRPPWRSCSPAWDRTDCAAPPTSWRLAAASSRRTRASSVVWGMPGSVANAGLCSAILPIDQIGGPHCALVFRRLVMTPLDYDYLRKLLARALRPRPLGGEAVPGREPAAAGRAPLRSGRSRRARAGAQEGREGRAARRRRRRGDDHQRDRSSSATSCRSSISATP